MAKDYNGSLKHYQLESKRKRLSWIFGVSGLCILSYIMGRWQNTAAPNSEKLKCDVGSPSTSTLSQSEPATTLDFESHHQVEINNSVEVQKFPPCDMSYSEYTPYQDPVRGRKFDRGMLKYRERHCPTKEELLFCLIPAPPKYKTPFKWPQSRDFAWYDNIPHKELSIEKAVQNWIHVEGERFRFSGGGTMFPRGADSYIDDISELIPLTSGNIRTAVDTGCGATSWGAFLLKRDIIAMSFAPRDTHEAQVQFALERGVPAMIGIMDSQRLPYPARAFDMAHCSRCLIPWFNYEGMYLIEVDRILRPTHPIEEILERKVVEKGALAIWQKPVNHQECIQNRKVYKTPHICQSDNPDLAWYKDMEKCITPLPEVHSSDEVAGGALEKWPQRAFAVPPRIISGSLPGISEDKFKEDNDQWKDSVTHYKRILPLSQGRYRNIMDMNAYLGGFASALSKYQVWVMNVVPANSNPDTLGINYHSHKDLDLVCDIVLILLEMDRVLRPEGAVIFRDTAETLVKIQSIANGMRWKTQITDHETGPFNQEKILIAVKTYWTADAKEI
ncbi:hypothetical protein L6164_026127 [Bauhinia variegata]|uniref:Uncharacterized protein n=1 Tax=Bauhinia variegata TaxID=167791 RepID=A0ACB9LNP7_BAUVA|nr:hypothetical protein L6164_026127 [Bauhinia variegata]